MVVGSGAIVVEKLSPSDARATARLHVDELPDGFFSELGPGFLSAYHASFARSPAGIALVARDGSDIVGFVVGASDERAHLAWVVRRRGLHLGAAAALALLLRPALAWHFLRTRGRRYARGAIRLARRRSTSDAATGARIAGGGVAGVLSHVAVAPASRGRGIGRRLTDAFVVEAGARGTTRVRTMTRSGSEGAAGLYESLGWQHVATRPDVDGRAFEHFDITP